MKLLLAFFLIQHSLFADTIPVEVKNAHERYIHTDFKKTDDVKNLFFTIKNAFIAVQSNSPANPVAEKNLLQLYNKALEISLTKRFPKHLLNEQKGNPNWDGLKDKLEAYELKNGKVIPLDWSLPDDFKFLVVGQNYFNKKYRFNLWGWMKDGKVEPLEIQVAKYPNELILDSNKKIGLLQINNHSNHITFSFDTEIRETPLSEGLYTLKIKMKDGKMMNAWFIMSKMASLEVPSITNPSPNSIFDKPSVALSWKDFQSSQLRPFEDRKRTINVYKYTDDSDSTVWSNIEVQPSKLEKMDLKGLKDGSYSFNVDFKERWFFGDLVMSREMTSKSGFEVKTK